MVCVWLPQLATDRLERKHDAARPPEPLVVSAPGKGGNRLVAVNAAAERLGLREGMLLTDATAIAPCLKAVPQDRPAQAALLNRLALWCRRYTPHSGTDGADGLWLDVTGAAHLVGGEAALLRDLAERFRRAGFTVRAAIASTQAAAWGMARFGRDALALVPPGEERTRLSPLSVRALDIAEEKAQLLDQLGLTTIAPLLSMPREGLRARFGKALLDRLDQALGLAPEGRGALSAPPVYGARLDFADPVTALEAIGQAATRLVGEVAGQLHADGRGARRVTLRLIDTGGGMSEMALALARPSHDAPHIARLLRERLSTLEGRFADTLAFDAAVMLATRVEVLGAAQADWQAGGATDDAALAALIDRLSARLGDDAVRRLTFRESHIPERASPTVPVLRAEASPAPLLAAPRPLLMLPWPEAIEAIAELPDYPPRRFIWRRVAHLVIAAEGPERIAAEWWRAGEEASPPRDYYTVEDEAGRRVGVYREGLYSGEGSPRWFMHGVFA
jgi:protein ImuB